MTETPPHEHESLRLEAEQRIDKLCSRFETEWQSVHPPRNEGSNMEPYYCFACLLFLATSVHAQGIADRLDADRDPLPDGAVARLGTARFRMDREANVVTLSPDGKTFFFAAQHARTLQLMDASSGKRTRQLDVPKGQPITGLNVLADGKMLVGLQGFYDPLLWDVASGKLLRACQGCTSPMSELVLSKDGKFLTGWTVATSGPEKLPIWETATGKLLHELELLQPVDLQAAFSSDGKRLATCGLGARARGRGKEDSCTVQVWDHIAGKELFHIETKARVLSNLVFSPDDSALICADRSGTLHILDLKAQKEVRLFRGKDEMGYRLVFSPDGKRLAASSKSGAVQVWEFATGRLLEEFAAPGTNWPPRMQWFPHLTFTSEGKLLLWRMSGHAVQSWDVQAKKSLTPMHGRTLPVGALWFRPGGRTVVSISREGFVSEWDPARGTSLAVQDLLEKGKGKENRAEPWRGVASPDGKRLLTEYVPGARLWDLATGKELAELQQYQRSMCVFSPDSRLFGVTVEGRAAIHDAVTGKRMLELPFPYNDIPSVAFSPEGTLFAATGGPWFGGQRELCVWSVPSGKPRWTITSKSDNDEHSVLAFAPRGHTLAVAEPTGAYCLRDGRTGEELYRWKPTEPFRVRRLAFTPDGRSLVVVGGKPDSADDVILVWETATATLRQKLSGHGCPITAWAFAPDSAALVTAGTDTTVLLWDLTGRAQHGRTPSKEMDAHWKALEETDGQTGFHALGQLLASPTETVALIEARLQPAPALRVAPEAVARLIADLDRKQFEQRERASQALRGLSERAVPVLREALEKKPSPEARRRITDLLRACGGIPASPELLRPLRSVEILERLATPKARQVLETLAGGDPEARLTHEAKAALVRLIEVGKPAR